jgi:hypothetical protein
MVDATEIKNTIETFVMRHVRKYPFTHISHEIYMA